MFLKYKLYFFKLRQYVSIVYSPNLCAQVCFFCQYRLTALLVNNTVIDVSLLVSGPHFTIYMYASYLFIHVHAKMPTFGNQNQGGFVIDTEIMCAQRTSRARSARPLQRGPEPALGPWKLWGSRCSLVQSEPYF